MHFTRNNNVNTSFSNPEIWSPIIPGFRDWKMVRDPGIAIPT